MIITNQPIQNVTKLYGEQNKVAKNNSAAKSGPLQQRDEVILSSQAQEVGQVYQAMKNVPAVRADKVQEFSAKIAAGSYHVDAKEIAAQMLAGIAADRQR
jgi:negative regulator of flagellin synthesis FlgM